MGFCTFHLARYLLGCPFLSVRTVGSLDCVFPLGHLAQSELVPWGWPIQGPVIRVLHPLKGTDKAVHSEQGGGTQTRNFLEAAGIHPVASQRASTTCCGCDEGTSACWSGRTNVWGQSQLLL